MAFDLILKRGSLSQFIDVTLRDAGTGQGKSGILPSEVWWYAVPRSTNNANVGNCAAMPGIWVSAGWKERDSVGAPGLYRFGVPNAVLSEGDSVTLRFRVTGCIDKEVKILLVAADLQDADKLGLGYLNAAVGGIPAAVWSDASALKAADVWGHGERSLTDKSGFVLSPAQAYDNTGQAALLPVNVQQWKNTAVQTSGDNYPMVYVTTMSYGAAVSVAGYTWNRLLSDVLVADSIGLLVKDTLGNLGGLIELDGTLPRFTAKALELGAAPVWSHPDRALTDKAGFGLASAQSFNNTGQTSILPANTKEWAGAQVALHEGAWPVVYMGHMDPSLASYIGVTTWNVLALLPEAGTYGALLVNNLDAKISTRSTLTAANVWTYASRSLTDKSGFSLSSTQAFNNTGQAALVPANVKQFEGNAVQISAGLPQVEVKAMQAGASAGIAGAVWSYDLDNSVAGAGLLLRSRLDAQVSSIGGGSLTPADVWAHADRSLTDKSGFSLAAGSISSSTFSPGAINTSVAPYLDAPVSSMGSLTAADVWAYADRTITGGTLDFRTAVREEAEWALQAYDAPTRTELALDRDQIITQVQTGLAGIGQSPSAAIIAAEVDAVLSAAHGAGAWVDQSRGTGPIDVQVSVRDAQGSPIALASVRLCVGPLGLSQQTDAFGNAVFSVEAGTYRVTAAKLGFSSAEAQLIVSGENASESTVLSLDALASIPPQAEADKTTGYLTTYDAMGNAVGGVEIQFRLVAPPAGAASSYSARRFTQVSDTSGLVTVKLLKHAAYELRREAGEWVFFRTDDRDTYPLPVV